MALGVLAGSFRSEVYSLAESLERFYQCFSGDFYQFLITK